MGSMCTHCNPLVTEYHSITASLCMLCIVEVHCCLIAGNHLLACANTTKERAANWCMPVMSAASKVKALTL